MPTTYTSLLGLSLPATGELGGTWGNEVNNGITSLLDGAIAGTTTLNTDADVTLTTTTGAANQARQQILLCTGARTVQRNITAPAQSKTYVVINATTGGFGVLLRGVGPTAGVVIANGERALVAWNGADFVKVAANTVSLAQIVPKTLAEDPAGGATDIYSYGFRRRATYSGGTPGFVNSGLRVDTYVESSIGSGTSTAAAYEWAVTGVVWNYSSAGENVGGYFQGRKYSTGATWGAVIEVLEYNNPGGNPTQGTVGLELDVNCNGPDTNAPFGSRVGLDLAIRKTNPGGSAAEVAWGYRIQGDTGSKVDRGYSFYPGMTCNKAFDASTATCLQAAFALAENQIIGFNGNLTRQLTHNGGGYIFKTNSASQWALNDDGSLVVLSTQILGTRNTGWTAMTGTANKATAYDTSTVTLAQLAGRVMSLQAALTQHGLIGT